MSKSLGPEILESFDGFTKLSDTKGFIPWKRSVRDILITLNLWKWTEKTNHVKPEATEDSNQETLNQIANAIAEWETGHLLTCTALRLSVTGYLYAEIENLTNAYDAYQKIEKDCSPRGSDLPGAFGRLKTLTIDECDNSPTSYVNKFGEAVEELQNFSTKLRLDENLLIWWFHSNLGPGYEAYIELYNQTHQPFDEEGTAKYDLSYALNRFQNTFYSGVAVTTHALLASTQNKPPIRINPQEGCRPGHTCDVIKTVKFCKICKRPHHDIDGHENRPNNRRGRGNRRGGRGGT